MKIGYMRVSTGDKQSFDLQADALAAAGVDKRNIYSDQGSGAKGDRPGLQDALSFLKKGDCLVVWKLDRLGRSLPHLLELVDHLRQEGIDFCSITENLDTTTAAGMLIFSVLGALADFERSLISERVNAGLRAARKRGRKGGRPAVVTDEMWRQIEAALKAGQSKSSVARSFSVHRSTLTATIFRRNQLRLVNEKTGEPI